MSGGADRGQHATSALQGRVGVETSVLPPTTWTGGTFAWGERTYVMAIVNATPDSFSGDGLAGDPAAAAAAAVRRCASERSLW